MAVAPATALAQLAPQRWRSAVATQARAGPAHGSPVAVEVDADAELGGDQEVPALRRVCACVCVCVCVCASVSVYLGVGRVAGVDFPGLLEHVDRVQACRAYACFSATGIDFGRCPAETHSVE